MFNRLHSSHQFTLMTEPESFASLPDDARLWVYASAAPLSAPKASALTEHLQTFFATWSSHGRPVQGALRIQDQRFLLVAATLPDGDISGCGIDAAVHAIDEAASALGIQWVPALDVVYRDAEGAVRDASRSAFRALAHEGVVTAETPVFDMSLSTVGALRSGEFEQRAGDSWHARAFDLPHPA